MGIDNIIADTTDVDALARQRVQERAQANTQAAQAQAAGVAQAAGAAPRVSAGELRLSRDDISLVVDMATLVMLVLIWRRI